MAEIAVDIQKELFTAKKSGWRKYRDLFVGQSGWWPLLKYELINMLCQNLTGALGLLLRQRLYPCLLGSCGRGVTFGRGVVLRHPHKIAIGDNVVIDDNCLLDAKGSQNEGIRIGSGVFIGRNTILSCKDGDIFLGAGVNIGFNCEIFSGSRVVVGDKALLAAYTYLIGGGHEVVAGAAALDQERVSQGIEIGSGVWLGAGVKVLDGIKIGANSIVGAGAVVNRDIASGQVAVGVPARVIKAGQTQSSPVNL